MTIVCHVLTTSEHDQSYLKFVCDQNMIKGTHIYYQILKQWSTVFQCFVLGWGAFLVYPMYAVDIHLKIDVWICGTYE